MFCKEMFTYFMHQKFQTQFLGLKGAQIMLMNTVRISIKWFMSCSIQTDRLEVHILDSFYAISADNTSKCLQHAWNILQCFLTVTAYWFSLHVLCRCTKCDKAFHRRALYDIHVLSHVPKEEQPFVCCKCARRFHCEALLRQHERVHLPREERLIYPCDICSKK